MAFDRRHYYLTFGGSFDAVETWQCGIRFRPSPDPAPSDVAWDASLALISVSDILGILQGWFDDAPMHFSNHCYLTWAKLSALNTDGHLYAEPLMVEGTPRAGNSSDTPYAGSQQALCVSFDSGFTFGRANHGRFYLPSPNVQVEVSTWTWPSASASAWVGSIQPMLSAVEGEISTAAFDVNLSIMSKLGAGAYNDPRYLKVGRVPDVQRRRRRSIAEQYASYTY